MKFQVEDLDVLFSEGMPLFVRHFAEVSHYQDIPLSINWDKYYLFEENGFLRVYTARSDEGALIGYMLCIVQTNIRYSSSLQAVQDILFILPERRGFGMKFIKWCEDRLREDGVQVLYQHTKLDPKLDFSPILKRLKYEEVDRLWAKRLDR